MPNVGKCCFKGNKQPLENNPVNFHKNEKQEQTLDIKLVCRTDEYNFFHKKESKIELVLDQRKI